VKLVEPTDHEGLLLLARAAIRQALLADGALERARRDVRLSPAAHVPRAAFVTLRSRQPEAAEVLLRGCIGCTVADRPLAERVVELAPRAALSDPRFAPLSAAELPAVRIEISVLGPPVPLADPQRIEIGRHGVLLEHAAASALFLPQVARERRWDAGQLLVQLSRKAGLGDEDWRVGRLSVFEAEAFEEPDPD
jgi:hypothetical protein